jgi:hypothetical protein
MERTYRNLGFNDKSIEFLHKVEALGVDITETKLALYAACRDSSVKPSSEFSEIKSMINTKQE